MSVLHSIVQTIFFGRKLCGTQFIEAIFTSSDNENFSLSKGKVSATMVDPFDFHGWCRLPLILCEKFSDFGDFGQCFGSVGVGNLSSSEQYLIINHDGAMIRHWVWNDQIIIDVKKLVICFQGAGQIRIFKIDGRDAKHDWWLEKLPGQQYNDNAVAPPPPDAPLNAPLEPWALS